MPVSRHQSVPSTFSTMISQNSKSHYQEYPKFEDHGVGDNQDDNITDIATSIIRDVNKFQNQMSKRALEAYQAGFFLERREEESRRLESKENQSTEVDIALGPKRLYKDDAVTVYER